MPRVVFSKVMWAGRARALVLALMMVATLAASLLALAVATRSAEATFSGGNGLIVFQSDRNRSAQDIFAINPINGTTDRLTTFTTSHNVDPAVSPDGSRIAFIRDHDIWVMNASGMNDDGTGAMQITTSPSIPKAQPTWSPDGTRIAFVRNNTEIYTINADGTDETHLSNDPAPADPVTGSQPA